MRIQFQAQSPYTNQKLRDRVKARVLASSSGGNPGQWSARKAQILAASYKKAGGGYRKGGLRAKQKSLRSWTKQKWRTNSGRPSLQTGERYLPDRAWKTLTPAQKGATNRVKRAAMRSGKQFVGNTGAAKKAGARIRRRIR